MASGDPSVIYLLGFYASIYTLSALVILILIRPLGKMLLVLLAYGAISFFVWNWFLDTSAESELTETLLMLILPVAAMAFAYVSRPKTRKIFRTRR